MAAAANIGESSEERTLLGILYTPAGPVSRQEVTIPN